MCTSKPRAMSTTRRCRDCPRGHSAAVASCRVRADAYCEHSLSWVDAHDERGRLIGFVNVAWDGGTHAFALDVVVDPLHQRRGVGRELVAGAGGAAAAAGCTWLHVDFEVRLTDFYLGACGFTPSPAGVLRLDQR